MPKHVRAHGALVRDWSASAAILFADLQMSGMLSRKLPSAAYFQLVRAITPAIDDIVIHHTGIVGKHAGDGVTAFFLAEDLGSAPGAPAHILIRFGCDQRHLGG